MVKNSFKNILENPGIATNQQLTLETFATETFALVDEAFMKIPGNVSLFVYTTVQSLLETIDNQIPSIVSSIEVDVGSTEMLSNIYNATYTVACLDIIAPVNCVWSGLGLTLLSMALLFLVIRKVQQSLSANKQPPVQRPKLEARRNDDLREEI